MAVTHFQVNRRRPFEGGRSFGEAGAYERFDVSVHFAVDPAHPMSAGIADLGLAPRDAAGRVHFEADLVLLAPADPAKGNRRLYSSVVNRGRTAVLPFSFPPQGFVPGFDDRIEPGDGFLLERGWTVALSAWQWDVVRRPGALGLVAPIALEADGSPAATDVTVRFQPLTQRESEYLGHWPAHPNYTPDRVHTAYPAADLTDPGAALTVRDAPEATPTVIDRALWSFARCNDGVEEPDATWVTLAGGFEPGRIYELTYRTRRCPVAGLGLLSIRDIASFLRFGTAAEGNPVAGGIDHALVHGVSQTGRFLREFLMTGCNLDEGGRQVFDGVFVQIAGARRGEFNFRGAQPSAQYGGKGQAPPYAYTPAGGIAEGLIDEQIRRGGVPKIFEMNTANEYWRSDGALVHTDPDVGTDLDLPEHLRVYLMAGCQHAPGFPFLTDRAPLTPEQRAGNAFSILNYTPLVRAALVNLERWACDGIEPPATAVPRLEDGTLVVPGVVLDQIAAIPGAALPTLGRVRAKFVPAVDADGNDRAGIRLPELSAPLATSAGWNPRHPETGAADQFTDMAGSTFPFAKDAASRPEGDARASIAERYGDRDGYLGRVREAAEALAGERYLLADDIERSVTLAGRLYDRLTG